MRLLLVVLFIAGTVFAAGTKEDSSALRVEVSGKVRMVGNSPMTSLVISGQDREWFIEAQEAKKLMDFQQQVVTVQAHEYYHDRVYANGNPAGKQYYLKNIVIIQPKQAQ